MKHVNRRSLTILLLALVLFAPVSGRAEEAPIDPTFTRAIATLAQKLLSSVDETLTERETPLRVSVIPFENKDDATLPFGVRAAEELEKALTKNPGSTIAIAESSLLFDSWVVDLQSGRMGWSRLFSRARELDEAQRYGAVVYGKYEITDKTVSLSARLVTQKGKGTIASFSVPREAVPPLFLQEQQERRRPFIEALQILEQRSGLSLVSVESIPDKNAYRIGEKMHFELRCERAGCLYVYHYGTGDYARLFLPQSSSQPRRVTAGETVRLPTDETRSYVVAGPVGIDIFYVVLTPEDVPILRQEFEQLNQTEKAAVLTCFEKFTADAWSVSHVESEVIP